MKYRAKIKVLFKSGVNETYISNWVNKKSDVEIRISGIKEIIDDFLTEKCTGGHVFVNGTYINLKDVASIGVFLERKLFLSFIMKVY